MTGNLASIGAFPIVERSGLCRAFDRGDIELDASGLWTRKLDEHPPAKAEIAITLIKIALLMRGFVETTVERGVRRFDVCMAGISCI